MERTTESGRDGSVVLARGRVLEFRDCGDPDGRPMLFHPGTPVTRLLGRWGHEAAVAAGVRLIAINRPGYGGSTPVPSAYGLRAVGRDTAELASLLGLPEYGVLGSSGGGPFAVAAAIAAPEAVRVVGLIGAVGPWRDLEPEDYGIEDRACLAMADAGDYEGAWDCLAADVDGRRGHQTPSEAALDIVGEEPSAVAMDADYRALWAENMQIVLANVAGYVFDNIAWGAAWDVDPSEVTVPAFLLYGGRDAHCSLDGHASWYRDRLPHSELVVLPDAAHFEVIDGHWPEVLAGLLRTWGPAPQASSRA